MLNEKRLLRAKYKKLRAKLDISERSAASRAICERLAGSHYFKNAELILCFIGMEHEVDTYPIFEAAWANGKRTAAPVIVGQGVMEFREITTFDGLIKSSFGVLEPLNGEPITPSGRALAVVPGLAFGENFARVGYGGGYYDKYFFNDNITLKFGVCFDFQLIPHIGASERDMILDGVMTENRVITR